MQSQIKLHVYMHTRLPSAMVLFAFQITFLLVYYLTTGSKYATRL